MTKKQPKAAAGKSDGHPAKHTATRKPGHFRYLFERDTVFATLGVFVVIILFMLIPMNIHIFDPIKIALSDFEYNDIAYARLGKNAGTPIDRRLVIVNIGQFDREEIARLLDLVSKGQPSVIGVDILFEGPRDQQKDSLLRHALRRTPSLVTSCRLDWGQESHPVVKGYFDDVATPQGYANFIGEEKGCIRFFSPFEKIEGKTVNSFAATVVQQADKNAFAGLQAREKVVERINYARRPEQYQVVQGEDLLEGKLADNFLRHKIVLLGYISRSSNDIEDKYFTPMNSKFIGKSVPDMNGVLIQANIISMVLDARYIHEMPHWLVYGLACLIGWLHIAVFIRYYIDKHIWFHLVAKIAQLLSAVFFVYLGLVCFDWFDLHLDMTLTIAVIVLAIDVIYFYEALMLWLNRKFHSKTIFTLNHHFS